MNNADSSSANEEETMTTRSDFERVACECGSDAVSEENAILQVGREFLPPCAIVVLDGGEATPEYWEFLISQTEQAQAEHDAEYAAGHEWHQQLPAGRPR